MAKYGKFYNINQRRDGSKDNNRHFIVNYALIYNTNHRIKKF